jgi:hypothetical protein
MGKARMLAITDSYKGSEEGTLGTGVLVDGYTSQRNSKFRCRNLNLFWTKRNSKGKFMAEYI